MRKLLVAACRAFPRDHRARRSDEVVDTALLAAGDSALRRAPLTVVAAVGAAVAAAPSGSILLTGSRLSHPSLVAVAAAGLVFVQFARLVHRRLA